MISICIKACVFLSISFCFAQSAGDSNVFFKVNSIDIVGNRRTKATIITRELDFVIGDSFLLEQLKTKLLVNRNKIFNTGLFVSVDLVVDSIRPGAIVILLSERWYTFPIPLFDLADRSFNEWWYRQQRSLDRINYGMWFEQLNMRGRNEKLKILVQSGFTHKYEFLYNIPYIDARQRHGLSFGIGYAENKEIFYRSLQNKQVFLKSEQVLRSRFFTNVIYRYRRNFFDSHHLEFKFSYNTIADTVRALNPDYFLNGNTTQRFFSLKYNLISDHRDVQMYALSGYHTTFVIEKLGIGLSDQLNLLQSSFSHNRYATLGRNFFYGTKFKSEVNLPNRQPYFNLRALGYGQDYVRGYDLYVIDGSSYGYFKNTLRKRLLNRQIVFNKLVPIKQFRTMPLAIYLNVYNDYGYAYRQSIPQGNSRLLNDWLIGYGAGVDVVTFYDVVLRSEYSFNKYGERGLYFYILTDIVF